MLALPCGLRVASSAQSFGLIQTSRAVAIEVGRPRLLRDVDRAHSRRKVRPNDLHLHEGTRPSVFLGWQPKSLDRGSVSVEDDAELLNERGWGGGG